MNFTEFCEALRSPLYEVKGKDPTCPKGFRWDKKLKQCVLVDTSEVPSQPRPDALDTFVVWGATGLDGDGYAMEDR